MIDTKISINRICGLIEIVLVRFVKIQYHEGRNHMVEKGVIIGAVRGV